MEQWLISDRWLDAQRLGVTASILLTHPGTHPAFSAARKILQEDMTGGQSGPRGFDFFRSLPPWVLTVLTRSFKQRTVPSLNRFAVLAEKALQRNSICSENETSTIARAQIWSYHVLLAHTRTEGLLRLGRTLFGHFEEWLRIDSDPISLEEMASCLETIRNPLASTQAKCGGVLKLSQVLSNTPFWEQTENILYHNQFCWPLMIFETEYSQRRARSIAFSLPVAVDVFLDNRRQVRQTAGAGILAPRWEKSLERAVHAAKILWRSEHENYGSFRDMVERASVTVDFSPAEKIIEILANALNAKVSLSDRSAEAYFSQVVLARLLGHSNIMVNAVTGVIGDQIKDENSTAQPNFRFDAPQGISEKIEYVAATGFFERIVLPESTESKDAIENFLKKLGPSDRVEKSTPVTRFQPMEFLVAEDLQSVADHVHPLGWRQRQYIRCPELEWAIHSKGSPGLLRPSEDKRVKEVMARLAANASRLLRLEVPPIVVGSALGHIDQLLHRNEPGFSAALSWVFINVSDNKSSARWHDEKDIFFWELFFGATGLGSHQLVRFLCHPSQKKAVEYLTAYLNRFVPGRDQPHRCPDFLVIIGSQIHSSYTGRLRGSSFRPFMVNPILDQLQNTLLPIGKHHDSVSRLIGKTRIIILPDGKWEESMGEAGSLNDLTGEEVRQLRYLATLEESFTSSTARLLLSYSSDSPEQILPHAILDKFLAKGVVRCVHGKYHVPSFVARQIATEEAPEDKVKRYYAAGAALAPYAVRSQGTLSMGVDAGFTPEYFEEASQHFKKALPYSRRTGSVGAGSFRRLSEAAIQRLNRFVMAPSWANVSRLLKAATRLPGLAALEPYEKSCELLRWYEEEGIAPHPFNLVTAASSATNAASCISHYVKQPDVSTESFLELHFKARQLYLQALNECSVLPKRDRKSVLLFCLAKYLAYLCSLDRSLIEHETLSEREKRETEIRLFWSRVVDLLNLGVKVLTADSLECFERMGDREPDHSKALDIYAKSIPTGRFWAGLSLKTWGAISLCGLSDRLNDMLLRFPARRFGHLIYKAYYYSAGRRGEPCPHEALRIREGMKAFERFYGNDPHAKATKAAFDRDYGRAPIRYCLEKMGPLVRGVVTALKKDQQQGLLLSNNGRQYRFPAFQLAAGLAYGELAEGMELDFQVLREGTEGEIGEVVNVRKPVRPGGSPVQIGRVLSLNKESKCGFISSGGREYHFDASNVEEGLAYEGICEGMWVEFQINVGRGQGESDEANSVDRIKDDEADEFTSFRGTYSSRGTVYELKVLGRYGFIVSGGRDYYFHTSYLTTGLAYDDIYEGTEIEFDVARESTAIRCGQAKDIRRISKEDPGDMVRADSSEDHNDGSREKLATVAREIAPGLTLRGKVAPFKGDGRYGLISAGGTDYYFKESDLRAGLTYQNVYEGMEVEFQVAREGTPGRAGMAINVRPGNDLAHEAFPVQRGVVYCLVPKLGCGFISVENGKEYQFTVSDLRRALKYEDIHEGTEVTFQIMKEPDTKAGKAVNVRLLNE